MRDTTRGYLWPAVQLLVGLAGMVLLILYALAQGGCAVVPPPVVSPDPAHLAALGADCGALWRDELGRDIDPAAQGACVEQLAAGRRTLEDYRTEIRAGAEYAAYRARLEAERRPQARRGLVRLADRTMVDDDGPFLGLGTSLFWGAWGYLHDRARLEQNLACAAGRLPEQGCTAGVDFIRVFALVGPEGLWAQRTVSPEDVIDRQVVAGLTDLAYDAYGLRLEWTIVAGTTLADTPAKRREVTRALVQQLQGRAHKVQFVEISNEEKIDQAEHAALAALVAAGLPNLIALTAVDLGRYVEYSAGTAATLRTAHLERDVSGTGGMFRPIRQAREFVDHGPWVSNEPIGFNSSVASDSDPARLALSAVYTWLCRGAAYVLHSGAGIYGLDYGSPYGQRRANLWEQPGFTETVQLINAARAVLPPDLPNWSWSNNNSAFPQFPFALPHFDGNRYLPAPEDHLLRSFIALHPDGRFVMVPIKVEQPVPFTAKRAMTFDVRLMTDPSTVVASVGLQPGQTFTLAPTPGALFIGRFL